MPGVDEKQAPRRGVDELMLAYIGGDERVCAGLDYFVHKLGSSSAAYGNGMDGPLLT